MLDTLEAVSEVRADPDDAQIAEAIEAAVRAVPPAWPLASSVAVNPFLGQTERTLAGTGALLARLSPGSVTMPRSWFQAKIAQGAITDDDLEAALAASPEAEKPGSLAELKAGFDDIAPADRPIPTVTDLAADVSGIDWAGISAERFGAWAAGHFDAGQALWSQPRGKGAYAAWRATALHDLTPEIAGLSGFARFVADAPEDGRDAIVYCARMLGIDADAMPDYFHRLLIDTGGWAHYGRYILWQAELAGETDDTLVDCLAICLIWEAALYRQYVPAIGDGWTAAIRRYARPATPGEHLVVDTILQEAHERAFQRELSGILAAPAPPATAERPALQMAFCIDVRSEVFRRALEARDRGIQTIGFAGFFGVTAAHRAFASDISEHRLPVLLNAGLETRSGGPADAEADLAARFKARAIRAWGRFKLAAVSSFAFVEASGPLYIAKLVSDALGLPGTAKPADPAPQVVTELTVGERTDMAATVLGAMSMTDGFARLVILAGHGASVVNNPHHSALNCGACGGYSGEVNARLIAALLNDPDVRSGLAAKGVAIPADTLFVAALHDTTSDDVTLYSHDNPSTDHQSDLAQAQTWLAAAGRQTRTERALRLPHAADAKAVTARTTNWSEIRPEWGTCRVCRLHRRAARTFDRKGSFGTRVPARLRLAAGRGVRRARAHHDRARRGRELDQPAILRLDRDAPAVRRR